MYKKTKKGKTTFKLADTAKEAKKLVTVGGLSESSAEGERCGEMVGCDVGRSYSRHFHTLFKSRDTEISKCSYAGIRYMYMYVLR